MTPSADVLRDKAAELARTVVQCVRTDKLDVAIDDIAEALLAAKAEGPDWQPIESAPKDAPQIILGRPGLKSWVGRWAEHNYVGVGEPKWIGDDGHGCPTPTHWQALPAPPVASEETRR